MNQKRIYSVLHHIYLNPAYLSSNFARTHRQEVAALASLGLITTQCGKHAFGNIWRPTEEGIELLKYEGYL